MSSITLENSYHSTAKDMGDSHIKAHAKQRKYLQSDEPLIETLTNNKNSDNSVQLALNLGQQKQGLMTPEYWLKYNSKQRKSRRKNNYTEYLMSVSGNFIKGKERRLNSPKTNKKTREKISRELQAIISNSGVPIDGSLFYISNTENYDQMSPDQLKKYREFERKTFENFFKSDTFQMLNPGCFRAEIHFDENGAMHLQTQNVWYHQDARKRVSYAKRAIIKNILKKLYRNSEYNDDESLNHRLDVLCEFEEAAKKRGKAVGTWRADYQYLDYIKRYPLGTVDDKLKGKDGQGNKYKYKHSSAERNTRLEELWRIEQMSALREIAESTAKSMNIDYKVDENYATDGIHLDGAAYIAHKKASQKAQTAMSLANQVKNASESVSYELKSTYKAISGEEPEEQSPLELAKKIKAKATTQQKDFDDNQAKIKQQEQLISQQQLQLTDQQHQLRDMQKQRDVLKKENQDLSKENAGLKAQIKQLHKQLQSAGLIVTGWIKEHWNKLEQHFKTYARDINAANNERIHGGRDGQGDPDEARQFEQRAKNGLVGAFENIERKEAEKYGLNSLWSTNSGTQKDDELQR